MTKKQINILAIFIIANLLLLVAHWYAFMYIAPIIALVGILLHTFLLINLPYDKFKTPTKKS